jgi:Iap family predicted aminopeptidase
MKTCSKCNGLKEFDCFVKSKINKDGYCGTCKDCRREINQKNREFDKKYLLEYNLKNIKIIKNKRKIYNLENQDKIEEYWKKYYKLNKQKIIKRVSNYSSNRKKIDSFYRLKATIRTRISDCISGRGYIKDKTSQKLLGTKFEKVKSHLEKLFTEGMSWDNYGKWHVDHIMPLVSAKNKEELYKLFHYKNLQPLWAIDNLRKGGKF